MGINFDSIKFYVETKMLGIIWHQIFVEANWLIEKVEKYYISIYCIYNIIYTEI